MLPPPPLGQAAEVMASVSKPTEDELPAVESSVQLSPKPSVVGAPRLVVVEPSIYPTVVLHPLAFVQVPVVLRPVLSIDRVGWGPP